MKKIFALIFICLISISIFAQENSRTLTKAKVDELCAVTGMTRDSIEEFTIPEEYTVIGKYAFAECFKLKNIKLHSNITVIEDYAFARTAIKDLTIPDTIVSIGTGVFGKCYKLHTLTILAKIPPKVFGSLEGRTDYLYTGKVDKIFIYVPDESVEAYKTAWSENEYSYFCIYPISNSENFRNATITENDKTTSNTSDKVSTVAACIVIAIIFALPVLLIIWIIRIVKKIIRKRKNENEQNDDDEKKDSDNEKKGFLYNAVKKITTDERMEALNAGNLPVVDCGGVFLTKDEICHFHSAVSFLKVKERVIGYKSGSSGTSFRISKGISIHTGSGRKQAIRGNVAQETKGYLTITNERIIGSAINISFDKKIDSLSSIQSSWDEVLLQFGKEQYYIKSYEARYIAKIIHLIAKQ